MDFRKFFIRLSSLLCFVALLASAKAQSFTIVGNNTGFKTTTAKNLKSIFKGKYSSWKNKEGVIIVLPSTKSDNAAAVAKYLYNTTVTGMQKYWLAQVFQGRCNPPVFLETDTEIVNYVKRNSGAIGIVRSSTKDISSSIKITIEN
jgi:ABC-type phosphate transport system substrate-binding protein